MKSAVLWFGALGVLVIGVVLFQTNYDEWFVYPDLRSHVNNQMKDPSSTQYRNERRSGSGWLCGELNSKNGNGGYVGFKRFVTKSADEAYMEGYGYVGTERKESTDQVLEQLGFQIAILKKNNERVSDGAAALSKSEINEMVAKEIFEKRWKQNCSTS